MLEATPQVFAKRIVYDPQNPVSPAPFAVPPGGCSSAMAYVLNSAEARKLGQADDVVEAARMIAETNDLEAVVVKCGPWGAVVYENGRNERIPAYATHSIWPIGSGDVFAAVFAARWGVQGLPAIEAAEQASRAAAQYVNDHILPIPEEALDLNRDFPFKALKLRIQPLDDSDYHVYLAAPFFNIGQSWLLEEARLALRTMGLKVFSPCHDVGLGSAHDVAPKDIEAIRHSRTMLALIDGLDAGTIFEVGYARSLGIPVIALAQSTPEEPLKMIKGSGCNVVSDFVTGIYQTSWAAQRE
jgi:nucleoside 2-deoxyribosyltransferase